MTSTKEYVQRDDGARRANRQLRGKGRCRKRLSTLLHTHVALILVCTVAALDAACVIGQIICDILIMKETLHEWEVLDRNLTSLLVQELPMLNATTSSAAAPAELNLEGIRDTLWDHGRSALLPHQLAHTTTNLTTLTSQLEAQGIVVPSSSSPGGGGVSPQWLQQALQNAAASVSLPGSSSHSAGTLNVSLPASGGQGGNDSSSVGQMIIGFFKIPVSPPPQQQQGPHSRRRRSAEGATARHDLLHDLTHSFHLGSMILLSLLLAETLLKVFAMGKKILHHKLEIFDAFVVSVSWSLDVAFWEGIWAHPGTEAATILIFILPWRVVRIVNSFVLVIQEKDHVQLKIVKQRLRLSVKKSKESTRKASSYRTEVKQLQGLCRKYGAAETEITACGPTGRTGRRRSSLLPAMERAASLTLISALGSHPSLYTMDSSSEGEGDDCTSRDLTRSVSHDPTLRSAFSVTTLDSEFTIGGKSDDLGISDNELDNDNDSSAEGLDDSSLPVFITCDERGLPKCRVNPAYQHPAGDPAPAPASEGGRLPSEVDVESGGGQRSSSRLAQALHHRLSERPSMVSTVSTISDVSLPPREEEEEEEEGEKEAAREVEGGESSSSGGSGADPSAQEVPPRYHQAVSKQDSNTRL